MKTLKFIFFTFLLSTFIYSCTDDEGDYQTNIIENTQATGGENITTNNGSKD